MQDVSARATDLLSLSDCGGRSGRDKLRTRTRTGWMGSFRQRSAIPYWITDKHTRHILRHQNTCICVLATRLEKVWILVDLVEELSGAFLYLTPTTNVWVPLLLDFYRTAATALSQQQTSMNMHCFAPLVLHVKP
jgi:hypothetical protein